MFIYEFTKINENKANAISKNITKIPSLKELSDELDFVCEKYLFLPINSFLFAIQLTRNK